MRLERRDLGPVRSGHAGFGCNWEEHRENRTACLRVGAAADPDSASVFLDDTMSKPQPKPRTQVFLGGEEGLENVVHLLLSDAGAIIRDNDPNAHAV